MAFFKKTRPCFAVLFFAILTVSAVHADTVFVPVNSHPASSKEVSQTSSQAIRVALFTDVKSVYLLHGKDTISVTCNGDRLLLNDGKKKHKTPTLTLKQNKNLSASANKKFVNRYQGSIQVKAKKGKISVINVVDIEEYLRGVVPYEIGKLDAERYEALKVQAVAARTYAYRHLNSRGNSGFDVYADTRDQVYNGTTAATELTDKAIKETAHEIVTFNGEPIEAYYHSTCAGHTAGLEVWNRDPVSYLRTRSDIDENGKAFCSVSSYMKWERKFNAATLAKLVEVNQKTANVKKPKKFKKILNIVVEGYFDDGRVAAISVLTENGTVVARGDKVRWLFSDGGKILPSAAFTVKRKGGEWIFNGKGFGHGIGMCQMGARERAKAGQNYKQILEHYYSGAKVEKR